MQQKKLEKTILITNRLGLHARASAKFVELISKCKSKFVIKKGKKIVNGSSLLGLMTLAASKGTEIKIQCTGENSQEDLSKLVNLIRSFALNEPEPLAVKCKVALSVSKFATNDVDVVSNVSANSKRY